MTHRLSALLAVLLACVLPIQAVADDSADIAEHIYQQIEIGGIPWGSPRLGQKMAILITGAGRVQVVLHPEREGQVRGLAFLFIPASGSGDLEDMSRIFDVGPSGVASTINLGTGIDLTESDVAGGFADLIACIDSTARTRRMCDNPAILKQLLGAKK